MAMKADLLRTIADIRLDCNHLAKALARGDLTEARRFVNRINDKARDLDTLLTIIIASEHAAWR